MPLPWSMYCCASVSWSDGTPGGGFENAATKAEPHHRCFSASAGAVCAKAADVRSAGARASAKMSLFIGVAFQKRMGRVRAYPRERANADAAGLEASYCGCTETAAKPWKIAASGACRAKTPPLYSR